MVRLSGPLTADSQEVLKKLGTGKQLQEPAPSLPPSSPACLSVLQDLSEEQ